MKKHLLQMASAASLAACLALPGLAQADVCRKIDYKFATKVYDQVVLHTANSYIYARDAACILKHVKFASEQEKIGVYLAGKLSDPENVNYLLKAVKMQHVRDKISQAALAAQPPPPPPPPPHHHHHPGHYPPPPPPPPRIQIVHNVSSKIDYTFAGKIMEQLQLYIGSAYIYSRDAAAIMKKIAFANYQKEIGIYLSRHLADPENINLMLNEVKFQNTREAITKAAIQNNAARPQPLPPPPPPPHHHHHPGYYPPPPPPPPRVQVVHNVHQKIDYTFPGKIMGQLRLYIGSAYIYSRDAAAIMKKIAFANYQEEIGIYLSRHLADPENINLMLNEVKFQNTRDAITRAAIQNNAARPQPPPPPSPYMPPPPPPPRVQVVHNVNSKIDYTFPDKIMGQVRLYIGNSYIYARDAAEILKKIDFPNYQKEVGAYLCPKIADRENLDVFIKAPDFPDVQNALTKACLGN